VGIAACHSRLNCHRDHRRIRSNRDRAPMDDDACRPWLQPRRGDSRSDRFDAAGSDSSLTRQIGQIPTLSSPCLEQLQPGRENRNLRRRKPRRAFHIAGARWRFLSKGGNAWAWRHHGRPFRLRDDYAIEDRADANGRAEVRSSKVRQVASRRLRSCHHQQPLAGPGRGPKSRESGRTVGVRSGACVEPRDDLSPARWHAPGAADRSAARSPLGNSLTRCLPWPTRDRRAAGTRRMRVQSGTECDTPEPSACQ
jgi:hypothetical protein